MLVLRRRRARLGGLQQRGKGCGTHHHRSVIDLCIIRTQSPAQNNFDENQFSTCSHFLHDRRIKYILLFFLRLWPYAVGLFPSKDSVEQVAFELAVHKVNLDPGLADYVKLKGQVEIVDINDSYRTSEKGKIPAKKTNLKQIFLSKYLWF